MKNNAPVVVSIFPRETRSKYTVMLPARKKHTKEITRAITENTKKNGERRMGKPRMIGFNKPYIPNSKADRKRKIKKRKKVVI